MNLMSSVTVFSNGKEFFFSTSPNQEVSEDFVPMVVTIPHKIEPIPSIPSGVIKTAEGIKEVYYQGEKEIPNPDPSFQP